ncbi:hypothetical protein [Dokdonella sp.]|uniref:hypothetical protein n=1 Tax=Dokdonella sp. TaxID=2291710 RepID=UPI0026210179|nr:hypothetical protein [Dokdonella sp.]
MRTLRICDIGLAPDTSHALHSMLKILEGRSSASWRTAPIGAADVLIAPAGCQPDVIADWSGRGRPVVLIADDRCEHPPSPFVLRPPLRVMPLLCVLDLLAEQLSAPPTRERESQAGWAAAESIRSLTEGGTGGWHVARTSCGQEIWACDGYAHAAASAFDRLRGGSLLMTRFAVAAGTPPAGLASMPLQDLGWFVGLHGPTGLAPWLSQNVNYALRRWPDFGRLGATPGVIELSAVATARPRTPADLVSLSRGGADAVHRFLAAASLAGLLAVRQPEAAPPPAATPPRWGAWTRLVGDLRRHLGLFT